MSVGRDIRIVSGRSDVVGETEAIVAVFEVHVEETLICSIKRDAPLSHSRHSIVVAHVWCQNHHTRVEQVRPSDIGGGGEGMRQVEQLIDGPVGNDVGIQVDQLSELCLLPQVDLGEGGMQIGSVHQKEIGRLRISYTWNWYYMVVHGLSEEVNGCFSCMALETRRHTLSCVMTSAETESRVTSTASFLDVPASRKEWASTRAPVLSVSSQSQRARATREQSNWALDIPGR